MVSLPGSAAVAMKLATAPSLIFVSPEILVIVGAALLTMRIVPLLGRPRESNWVIWASTSCPVGKSAIWKLMLKVGSKRFSGLSLYVLVNVELYR